MTTYHQELVYNIRLLNLYTTKYKNHRIWVLIAISFISTKSKAHRDSCYNYGQEEKIIKHNQFIHVELAQYWRDQDQLFAQFLADFFPQSGISVSTVNSNGFQHLCYPLFLFVRVML